jgi:hypothetical protein
MSEIPIPTAIMDHDDRSVTRLILSKDMRTLDALLAQLERTDIGSDFYLAHTPDLRHGWLAKDPSLEKPTGGTCRLCRQLVYHFANDWQQRVHCGCTIWILPLDVEGGTEIDSADWMSIVRGARRGITQWLRRN